MTQHARGISIRFSLLGVLNSLCAIMRRIDGEQIPRSSVYPPRYEDIYFSFLFFFLPKLRSRSPRSSDLFRRSDEDDPSGCKYRRLDDDNVQDKERFAR